MCPNSLSHQLSTNLLLEVLNVVTPVPVFSLFLDFFCQAFSGTVVEKDHMPSTVPHLTIVPPALPTILERKQEEVVSDITPPEQAPKRISKFKAARLQQK